MLTRWGHFVLCALACALACACSAAATQQAVKWWLTAEDIGCLLARHFDSTDLAMAFCRLPAAARPEVERQLAGVRAAERIRAERREP